MIQSKKNLYLALLDRYMKVSEKQIDATIKGDEEGYRKATDECLFIAEEMLSIIQKYGKFSKSQSSAESNGFGI